MNRFTSYRAAALIATSLVCAATLTADEPGEFQTLRTRADWATAG